MEVVQSSATGFQASSYLQEVGLHYLRVELQQSLFYVELGQVSYLLTFI
jgi:hypothetical protein